MADLRDRFRALDRVDAPDDVWRRAERMGPRPPQGDPAPSIARRAAVILIAFLIAALAIALPASMLFGNGSTPGGVQAIENGPLYLVGSKNAPSGSIQIYGGPASLWSFEPGTGGLAEMTPPLDSADPMMVFRPRWTPDGTHELWYTVDAHFGSGEIWTDVGGTLTKIVSCDGSTNSSSCVWEPSWSPDGTRIAFARGDKIMVVNADGSDLHVLWSCADCTGFESGPTWSPDGSRIAFAVSAANYDGVIYVANVEGNAELRKIAPCSSSLCRGGARDAFVQWSPTGDRLLFTRERNVWSIGADGSGLMQLTSCPVTERPNDCEPSTGLAIWSPDGSMIAYIRRDNSLVVMNADGSGVQTTLLDADYGFYLDTWQPIGSPEASSRATSTPSASRSGVDVLAPYEDPMGIPISLAYPSEWHAASVSESNDLDPTLANGLLLGVVISNTSGAMPSTDPAASPGPLPEDPHLPPDFVTVTILSDTVQTAPRLPDSPLPLSMADAKVAPGTANIRTLTPRVGGVAITITVQGGPNASPGDLARADAIVSSIRPSSTVSPTDAVGLLSPSPAPAIEGSTLSGDSISADDLRGRILVVGTWASWCGPCRSEVEVLQQIAAENASDDGVIVVGLNLDDRTDAAIAMAAQYHVSFPSIVVDPTYAGALGIRAAPVTWVVDPQGDVVWTEGGAPVNPQDVSGIAALADRVQAAIDAAGTA